MSTAFLFPGQGSQRPGMLHALPADEQVAAALAEAAEVLHLDPLGLDSAEALASTVAVQLSLLIAGVATARSLIARGARPDLVAGMSIGAFPAAVVAGALDYCDALRLVALRARLMEDSFPRGYGMTAIVGLDVRRCAQLVARVHAPASPVYVANRNAERQMVVAGAEAAMEDVARLALEHGATRTERLAVSVPSHCELLRPAADTMREALAAVRLRPTRIDYLSASSARTIIHPAPLAEDLASNMACPVNWYDTARLAWERGARLSVEMPSGNVLSGLTQEVFAEGVCVCSQDTPVDTIVALVDREHRAGSCGG
ncbi:malonate decarboxylase subunit epsilon [Aromatoleum petrolei]|uniref:Malonyl CoA-acyl carrier protein transacylase n=1 Tax=Aromatoleum petrolei TaxID=76116 RepID=A0ABX1MMV4_9RHOO|nr:malonate decarboxylase subunit epsilon [Aromatoleum petrolei]NMF87943.1 malonate decarboxylase subunit epsilon [Aromatoleum petrolei]QTQ36689.1 Malonyl-CoA-acyl carrier protein transacylase [Aromatoleum petrolei]